MRDRLLEQRRLQRGTASFPCGQGGASSAPLMALDPRTPLTRFDPRTRQSVTVSGTTYTARNERSGAEGANAAAARAEARRALMERLHQADVMPGASEKLSHQN